MRPLDIKQNGAKIYTFDEYAFRFFLGFLMTHFGHVTYVIPLVSFKWEKTASLSKKDTPVFPFNTCIQKAVPSLF